MPPTRRRILARRFMVGSIVGALAAGGVYLPVTLLSPVSAASASIDDWATPDLAATELPFPGYGASAIAAIGFDGLLGASGSTEPLPIASISKIITALVVLDAKPLAGEEVGPDIRFTAVDVALYSKYRGVGGKVEPVRAGLVLTQRDVLELALVSSANNYTSSLAAWAYGSEAAFVTAAAAWLAEHGFTGTTLVEPTGLSSANVSTASDLVRIGETAIANPVIAEIVGSPTVEVPFVGSVKNSNKLLGIDGVDGIKTGTLDAAGACLLFSADYPVGSTTVTVVGVVLGGVDHPSLDAAIRALLDEVEAGFHEVTLATEGEEFAGYRTTWGDSAAAVASSDATVLVWGDTPIEAVIEVEDVSTGSAGDPVGSVTFAVGDEELTVPLQLDAPISDPGPWWRLGHPFELR